MTEIAWLDADERSAWITLVAVLNLLPGAIDAQLRRDADLSLFEYSVLSVLSENPDRTSPMSALAEIASGSLSRLSHVARRLEDRGYLVRSPLPEDGRVTVATLTNEGLAVVRAVAPGHVRHVRSTVIDRLTREDLAAMHRIGMAVLDAISPEAAHGVRQATRRDSLDA